MLFRFTVTTNLSATLSSSTHFPLFTVIASTLLRQFLPGTRRVSPVARHVLVTVLSLPPRRSEQSYRSDFDYPCCLHPTDAGSTSEVSHFRGHLGVHSRYGPATRSPPLKMALSMGFRYFGFPDTCHSSYGGSDFYPCRTDSC